MKVLFLFPYPLGCAPSQRFRFEQYLETLNSQNIQVYCQGFWTLGAWNVLYNKGHFFLKIMELLKGFIKRIFIMRQIIHCKYIFIHRECTPIGPPIIEWVIARVFKKKIIFDFDDAIWQEQTSDENKLVAWMKQSTKFETICRISYKLSCGNSYLANHASRTNKNVVINPTTIDTQKLHNRDLYPCVKDRDRIVIGWTGTHSTLPYLHGIASTLQKLKNEFSQLDLLIISNKEPELGVPINFIKWSKESEIMDLLKIDIGIMPLSDDPWTQGKCGFKALQYMALEIPTLASPVGVNKNIIDHGINGFLCHSESDWLKYLSLLVSDPSTRKKIGHKGRQTVIQHYSVQSNTSNFLGLFS